MSRDDRIKLLTEALDERILVFGGPYGTYVHAQDLTPDDYGGARYEGCPEQLNATRPDVIEAAHRGYLEAGADIITTNTFGGGSIVLAEYGLQDRTLELNEAAARLSRKAADAFATPSRPRWVAGNLGPTTKSLSVTGGITFDELKRVYHDWAQGLVAGGVDLLTFETMNDTRGIKAALLGVEELLPRDRLSRARHGVRDDRADRHDARRPERRGARASPSRTPTCSRSASTARPARS